MILIEIMYVYVPEHTLQKVIMVSKLIRISDSAQAIQSTDTNQLTFLGCAFLGSWAYRYLGTTSRHSQKRRVERSPFLF